VKIDKGRGEKVGIFAANLKRGECICNLGGAEVIFSELANFSLI